MKILFVCTGNTCRSPMASAIFNKKCKEKGLCFYSDSCGIITSVGIPATKNAISVCLEIGIDISDHISTPITKIDLKAYDYIIALSENHKKIIKYLGVTDDKILILGNGVLDPFGENLEVYRRCRDEIVSEIDELITKLSDNKSK